MPISMLPSQLRLVLRYTVIAAVVGAVYSLIHVAANNGPLSAVYGVPRGLMTGAMIGVVLTSLEILVLDGPLAASIRRAPFALHVTVKTCVYLIVILFALELGSHLLRAPGERGIETRDVLFSLAVSFVFVFMIDVNRLLGQNTLLNFVTGRYHKPRVEDRVLLFIDMEGSTGLAERLGPLAFHRLLNCFVADLTDPIVAARGEIYSYVGDEVIATWKLEDGLAGGRCITACFAAVDQLERAAPEYRREFGAAVKFRAGLHCGPIVTGEMGTVKKEIVFLGDTVNTAARIQDFCRQTGDRVLASAELIDRLDLPRGVAKRSLGDLRLRGKGVDLALYALARTPETPLKGEVARRREMTKASA
jgi:adenylate cyclase